MVAFKNTSNTVMALWFSCTVVYPVRAGRPQALIARDARWGEIEAITPSNDELLRLAARYPAGPSWHNECDDNLYR